MARFFSEAPFSPKSFLVGRVRDPTKVDYRKERVPPWRT